ncbi:MAG: RNA polymerase sigma factor [Ignavibacteriota bacterium]
MFSDKIKRTKIDFLNLSKSELESLLISSKDGNSEAFKKISGYIREISYSYFLSKHRAHKIVNIDDVDDLATNVYISFAEQYHKIETIENWLRRVLFLTYVRWYKQNNQRRTVELDEEITSDDSNLRIEEGFDVNVILKVLDTLSEDKQEIVKLRFWGDLKFSEIADKLNKNEAAIKKMFYRTIEEIKNNLK